MYTKTLPILLGLTALFFTLFTFAGNDITKPDYTIRLCDMDPMHECGGQTSVPAGRAALVTILQNFAEILLFVVPLIAGISFIIAGYFYIFSAGDTEKTNKGKTIIKWNIVAIFVAFFSYTLVKLVAFFLS